MRLTMETEEIGKRAAVIAPTGELDLYTCTEFKDELLRVISNGALHVVVDLTRTTFVDSTALGVLLRGVERLRERDGRLAVVCAEESIMRIFEVTGLHRIFEIHASRAEALAAIDAS